MSKRIINVLIFLIVLIFLFVILPKTHIFRQDIFQRNLIYPIPSSVEVLEYKKSRYAFAIKFSANINDIRHIVVSKKMFFIDNFAMSMQSPFSKIEEHIILLNKTKFLFDDSVTVYSNFDFIYENHEFSYSSLQSLELLFFRNNIAVYIKIRLT